RLRLISSQHITKLGQRLIAEFEVAPVAITRRLFEVLRRKSQRNVFRGRRVENVVIPTLARGKTLLGVEVIGNQEGNMKEDLAIVDAVRAGEVQFLVNEAFDVLHHCKWIAGFFESALRVRRQQTIQAGHTQTLRD